MTWQHVTRTLLLAATLGCGGSANDSDIESPDSVAAAASRELKRATSGEPGNDSAAADSGRVEYRRLLATFGRFEAYAYRAGATAAPAILVRIAGRSPADSGITIPLAGWEAFPHATWVTPAPDSTPLLHLAWQESGEGSSGSSLYSFDGLVARRVFSNQGSACVPARIVDIDTDGRMELLSYVDEVHGCSLLCKEVLRDRGLGEPSWTEVFEWDGTAWSPQTVVNAAFWDSVALSYTKLANFARDSEHPLCRASRARMEAALKQWAARSRALAGSGRRPAIKRTSTP